MDFNITITQVSRRYFGYALSEPLVLHTTLGIAAVMWSILVPDPIKARNEGYKLKALAIPAIQARLQRNDTSNIVVGAIANMAQLDASDRNFEAAKLHLNGLKRIAETRGGYDDFKEDSDIGTTINWSDVLIAIGTNSKPTMPLLVDTDSSFLPASVLRDAETPSLSHLRVFEETPHDTKIRFAIAAVRQGYYASRSEAPVSDMRIACNVADHGLTTLVQDVPRTSLAHPLLIAAQIFSILVCRSTDVACPLVGSLRPRLVQSLQERMGRMLENREYWSGLTWCLWMGLVSTAPRSRESQYFSRQLAELIPKLRFGDSEQFKLVMQRFLWDDVRCDMTLQRYKTTFFPSKDGPVAADE